MTIRTHAYVRDYLARLERFQEIERQHGDGSGRLLEETARQLALAWPMRTRSASPTSRSARAASRACARKRRSRTGRSWRSPSSSIRARRRSPTRCRPASDAGSCAPDGPARLLDRATRKGKVIKTTSVGGFLLLYALSQLKPLRRRSLRFAAEQAALTDWLDLVAETARSDYALALQVARMRSLVKGYGDTHERGRAKFDKLAALVPRLRGQDDSGARLEGLVKAALADEGDEALDKAIADSWRREFG